MRLYGVHHTPTGDSYMVMEYMPCGSLDKLLQSSKSISHIDLLHMYVMENSLKFLKFCAGRNM